ncbi:MAG: amidohydrolase [Myxococcales bacterium]|nr:amidohydrolase [Myxococcales bacterium]
MANQLSVGPDVTGTTIVCSDGRISTDGSNGAVELACDDGTIEKGGVNAHTHIYSGLAPLGMPAPEPEPENFLQILERVWWRLDRVLDEESLRASARLYVAEALCAGTTALVDHQESPNFIDGSLDVLADACHELGMRAVLCYGATERNGGLEEARRGLDECGRFLRSGTSDLVRGCIGLHASFTVSDETIRAAADYCGRHDTVLHVHLAEDGADVQDAIRRGYESPLDRIVSLGALVPGSIFAHGVHLTGTQTERVVDQGCWLVQNPRSNEGNRVGYPSELKGHGRVALGTDGYPADMREEERALWRIGGDHGELPNWIQARSAASAMLVSERFGISARPLREGALGDLVVRRDDEVQHVVVNGQVVVRDGVLQTGDIEAIRAEAQTVAERLFTRMRAL